MVLLECKMIRSRPRLPEDPPKLEQLETELLSLKMLLVPLLPA
jgi:hypothetical protein